MLLKNYKIKVVQEAMFRRICEEYVNISVVGMGSVRQTGRGPDWKVLRVMYSTLLEETRKGVGKEGQ
jgi:hypothetical protein